MNRKFKLITKLTGAILVALVAVTSTFSPASAWGPERQTYTNESPASYATFNSITDNAAIGDERNFVRVREAGTNNIFKDEVEVVPGKEYEVYTYYHNNAASNTNASGLGVATSTKVSSAYPTTLKAGEKGTISSVITWSYITPADRNNAKTGIVWDEAYLTTKSNNVVLKYKAGTAIIHNAGKANGTVLPNEFFTKNGTLIGYDKLIGNLPGCAEYSGYITYTLVAENTDATLDKKVSLNGTDWAENVTAKSGGTVYYKVSFKNTGTTKLTNVTIKDAHDGSITLRSGTTKVNGKVVSDTIDTSGYNIGDVAAGATVEVIYQATVSSDKSVCDKTFKNTVTVTYNGNQNKTDDANIKVVCDPEPTCETNPELPECQKTCETNPELPECQKPTCETNPELPECQKPTCETNPEMEGCEETPDEIVSTGPVEIILAVVIILGIGGGAIYFYRTKKALKTVEDKVSGKPEESKKDDTLPKS